jgi:acetoin utilization deacetylase AcuC-like enzyme
VVDASVAFVTVLLATHPRFADHEAGRGHPERPARLTAVLDGIEHADLAGALRPVEVLPAGRDELERVHPAAFVDALERFCASGGGRIDADTGACSGSWDAALLAAGAGLSSIAALDAGEGDSALCVVRPPGHHATPSRAMGFCLLNNVAVVASALAARGERVVIVDYDAHHGNGTQDTFYERGDVLYISFHQWPLYPGTGAIDEVGHGDGYGATLNLPMPPEATGDVYRAALEEVVDPVVARFQPTWLLVSAGFDAHRRDPLTDLGLTSGDYADITKHIMGYAPTGQRMLLLEGGYDLEALADTAGAVVAALADGQYRPEHATSGGPGRHVVDAAARQWREITTG